jgi:hypothetical protein
MEGVACGLLSMSFSYAAINLMSLDPSVGIFIGSTAGFIGVERLRILFIKLIDLYLGNKSRKTDGGTENE